MTWTQTIERYLAEGRTVSGGKGDQTLKQSEELSVQNQRTQMDFNKQLMDVFQKQFGQQSEVLNYIKSKMTPMVENPTGFSAPAEAAMRTSATDTVSRNAQNAQQALNAERFAQGGRDLPSGVDDQLNAALLDSESAQKSSAQNNITLQNENLKQANYWNALNTLSGTGAQFNPQSYASGATAAGNSASGAADATATVGKAYFDSKAGFGTAFMNSLGSGLGGGIAKGANGLLFGTGG